MGLEVIVHYITHPGGAKVIDAYRQALGLARDELALTEAMLRDHGNISSASVLFVLEQWLASERSRHSGHGLLSRSARGSPPDAVAESIGTPFDTPLPICRRRVFVESVHLRSSRSLSPLPPDHRS